MMLRSFLNLNRRINMPRKIERKRTSFETTGESLTHQSEHDRSEINRIIKRGVSLPDPNQMRFGDFSDGATFNDVQNTIAQAKSSFELLPAELRDRFSNDPAKVIDFINDPENAEEAVELGLIEPLPEPLPKDSFEDKEAEDGLKRASERKPKDNDLVDSKDPPSTTPS